MFINVYILSKNIVLLVMLQSPSPGRTEEREGIMHVMAKLSSTSLLPPLFTLLPCPTPFPNDNQCNAFAGAQFCG